MLPAGLWKETEPRFGFPIFGNCVNRVSQALRLDFGSFSWKKAAKAELSRVKKARLPSLGMFLPVLTGEPVKMSLRGALTGRDGKLIHDFGVLGAWSAGMSLELNVNDLMKAKGIAPQDGMFILVMDLGARPEALTQLNIFSMSYEGEHFYTNYRTGAFARTLNDFAKKKHVGFMSVNPKVIVNETHLSSLLFINHSSNPAYDDVVTPKVQLIRGDGQTLDADFAPVPAFGGVERSMEDLFGAKVKSFLEPFGGLGTTVSRVPGYTLAGISVLRSRDGRSMSIEHTRPTQSYLMGGI